MNQRHPWLLPAKEVMRKRGGDRIGTLDWRGLKWKQWSSLGCVWDKNEKWDRRYASSGYSISRAFVPHGISGIHRVRPITLLRFIRTLKRIFVTFIPCLFGRLRIGPIYIFGLSAGQLKVVHRGKGKGTVKFNGSHTRELEETTRASPYHVSEHRPARSESVQPHTEWSSRSGSEPPSVEADVYVWRYALLVVHARKEEKQ